MITDASSLVYALTAAYREPTTPVANRTFSLASSTP